MEQTIERIKTVLSDVVNIKVLLEAEKNKVVNTGRKQDGVAKYQGEKSVELEERETAVKSIEDVVAFKQAAEKMAKQVDEGRIALENTKNKFDAFMKSEQAKIVVRKGELTNEEARYKREIEALQKTREEVEASKAHIKGQVLDSLSKNL